ncbi:MAG: zeta toxin family protein [Clostridia bacterium]|nr:zeta toxin family protein [Clostridia bacterium]
MDKDKFKLTNEEHEQIYKYIEEQTFLNKVCSEKPVAIILGGQPGAGKSFLIKEAKKDFLDKDIVVINGDEYRRWHPRSKEILNSDEEKYAFYTDPDVREWTSNLFEKAIKNKYNIIFEGTMRTNRICDTIKRLKEEGFIVKIKVLAVHEIDSRISTIERYESQLNYEGHGRKTPVDSHINAYNGMINTLEDIEAERMFDTLEILTRKGECVYSNDNVLKKVYSKYDSNIQDTLVKSRNEQKPPLVEVKERIEAISKYMLKNGESIIELEKILKEYT